MPQTLSEICKHRHCVVRNSLLALLENSDIKEWPIIQKTLSLIPLWEMDYKQDEHELGQTYTIYLRERYWDGSFNDYEHKLLITEDGQQFARTHIGYLNNDGYEPGDPRCLSQSKKG